MLEIPKVEKLIAYKWKIVILKRTSNTSNTEPRWSSIDLNPKKKKITKQLTYVSLIEVAVTSSYGKSVASILN